MPDEAKAAGYDQIPLDIRLDALEKSPVWSQPYGLHFFERMPEEAKVAEFNRLSIEPKLAQLHRSPVWSQPYGLHFFERLPSEAKADAFDAVPVEEKVNAFNRLSIEPRLAQLRRSPVWAQPEGPDFFERMDSAGKAFMLERMAVPDQAVLYERLRQEPTERTLD
jgi:hypothetical protein